MSAPLPLRLLGALVLLTAVGCTAVPPADPNAVPADLTYVTFNIGGGAPSRYGFRQPFDIPRAGAYLKTLQPDFVALQEVDRFVGRNRNPKRDTAGDLAKAAGIPYVTFGKAIRLSGGQYGNALLSRYRPLSVSTHTLKDPKETRCFIDARFRMADGRELAVCATHLSAAPSDTARRAQTDAILAHYRAHPADRLLLAGDLNAAADAPSLKHLETELTRLSPDTEVCTWLGGGKAIDHIYGRTLPGERWLPHPDSGRLPYTHQQPLSDHMPVRVRVRLAPAE